MKPLVSLMVLVQVTVACAQEDSLATRPLSVPFTELSGCAALGDGAIVVEDELVGGALILDRLDSTPRIVKIERKKKQSRPFTDAAKLAAVQDFEGVAAEGTEHIYFLGAHQGKEGSRRSDREFIIHCEWDGEELVWRGEYHRLLEESAEVLRAAGVANTITATTLDPDFNFEGLAYHEGTLYVGARSPLTVNGEALVLTSQAKPLFKDGGGSFQVRKLSLESGGIRAMEWDAEKGTVIIVSGPSTDDAAAAYVLWNWNPAEATATKLHTFTSAELTSGKPEGVARIGGKLVVTLDGGDDGKSGGIVVVDEVSGD